MVSGAVESLKLSTYGVSLEVKFANVEQGVLEEHRFRSVFPLGYKVLEREASTDHFFEIEGNQEIGFELFKNGVSVFEGEESKVLDRLDSEIRLTVGEFASGLVFVHSGAVSWKGRGILIPGRSFSGKTTLVAELVKQGATYYSDEYAILDSKGYLHPFPKTLSMRKRDLSREQTEMPVQNFGGVAGDKAIPVGLLLVTKYKKHARWNPKALSRGEGVLTLVYNALPVRRNPEFTLNVLNKAVSNARCVESDRGDVKRVAQSLLGMSEVGFV